MEGILTPCKSHNIPITPTCTNKQSNPAKQIEQQRKRHWWGRIPTTPGLLIFQMKEQGYGITIDVPAPFVILSDILGVAAFLHLG